MNFKRAHQASRLCAFAGDEVIMSIAGAPLSRHALAVLRRADGSEAARPRRDRFTPARPIRSARTTLNGGSALEWSQSALVQ
jgi:hypothetical protein